MISSRFLRSTGAQYWLRFMAYRASQPWEFHFDAPGPGFQNHAVLLLYSHAHQSNYGDLCIVCSGSSRFIVLVCVQGGWDKHIFRRRMRHCGMPEALFGRAKLGTIKRERHMVYAIKKSELRVFWPLFARKIQ